MQSQDNNNNLKTIRKDQGLSLEEVSRKLKLSVDVINKLEKSEFESLGAFTYVRGYLIHYTNLLGVESDKYIQLIDKNKLIVPLINTSSALNKGIKLKSKSKNFASYAIGTFIIVAVSFSGWYLLTNYSNSINSQNIADSSELELLPQQETSSGDINIPDKTENDNSFHYSSLIPTNQEKEISDTDSGELSILIPETPIDSTNPDLQTDINVADENTQNENKKNPVYNIVIEANETSWVKVELMDGTKLHNDLLNPGTITLESDEQVHFRIGNEKQVKVNINGEQIDLSSFAKKDIADFNWPLES